MESSPIAPPWAAVPRTNETLPVTSNANIDTKPGSFELHAIRGTDKADHVHSNPIPRLSISPGPTDTLLSPITPAPRLLVSEHASSARVSGSLRRFWLRNYPAILVALSQLFGALMNLSARLLEFEGDGMHPIQVLLVRQSMTAAVCLPYMWWASIPHAPVGPKGVRLLLWLRGFAGFCGIYGMWYSMMYLPLADATVISFLGPGFAGIICYFVLKEPFTRAQQLATLVALGGVVLIAKPAALFGDAAREENDDGTEGESEHHATADERLIAVGMALLGVLGSGMAFTMIRTIGQRAHALISVNFFAMVCVLICVTTLVFAPMLDIDQPQLRWRHPSSAWQWTLLVLSGIFGFVMQILLTTGLAADKSNKANSMVYTHMLFAVAFDRWVFNHRMGVMSFLGCSLIFGSAISIFLMAKQGTRNRNGVERRASFEYDVEESLILNERPRDTTS